MIRAAGCWLLQTPSATTKVAKKSLLANLRCSYVESVVTVVIVALQATSMSCRIAPLTQCKVKILCRSRHLFTGCRATLIPSMLTRRWRLWADLINRFYMDYALLGLQGEPYS